MDFDDIGEGDHNAMLIKTEGSPTARPVKWVTDAVILADPSSVESRATDYLGTYVKVAREQNGYPLFKLTKSDTQGRHARAYYLYRSADDKQGEGRWFITAKEEEMAKDEGLVKSTVATSKPSDLEFLIASQDRTQWWPSKLTMTLRPQPAEITSFTSVNLSGNRDAKECGFVTDDEDRLTSYELLDVILLYCEERSVKIWDFKCSAMFTGPCLPIVHLRPFPRSTSHPMKPTLEPLSACGH